MKSLFNKNKKQELPFIARVNLVELQKEREKNMHLGEVCILAKADYTKRIPTIRLYYVALEKFTRYGTGELKVGQTIGISNPFRLPNDMSIEDACKIVSFLSDKVEKENYLAPACERSVSMVSHLLPSYGFEKVHSRSSGHYHAISEYSPFHKIRVASYPQFDKIDGVVDLFTVGGDFKAFKTSDLHDRYFDWYTEGVTKEEVKDIYKNIRKEYLLPDSFRNNAEKTL